MVKLISKIGKCLKKAVITYAISVVLIKIAEQTSLEWSKPEEISEALKILEEEKQKLGITNRIDLYIYEEFNFRREDAFGFSVKTKEGYLIASRRDSLSRDLIAHELYHIRSGDLEGGLSSQIPSRELMEGCAKYFRRENPPNIFTNNPPNTNYNQNKKINRRSLILKRAKYWTIQEPRAGLYALTRIRL